MDISFTRIDLSYKHSFIFVDIILYAFLVIWRIRNLTINIPEDVFEKAVTESTSLLEVANKFRINWKTARRLVNLYNLSLPSGQSKYHAENEKGERNRLILQMKNNGRTYGEIGAMLGISRQRVYKLVKKYDKKDVA